MMERAAEHDTTQELDDLSMISMNSEDTAASDTMLIMEEIRHEMKWTDNAALRQTTITEFSRPVSATKSKPTAKRFKQATLTGIWHNTSNTMNKKKTTTLVHIMTDDYNNKISGADAAACEPHISTGPTIIDKKNSKKKTRKKRRKKIQKKKALARAKIKTKYLRHADLFVQSTWVKGVKGQESF